MNELYKNAPLVNQRKLTIGQGIGKQLRCNEKKSFLKIEIKNRKDMNRKIIAYFLIFASLILLIFNITELNFDNLKENRYTSIVSNLLLILAMIFTIRDINKKKNV